VTGMDDTRAILHELLGDRRATVVGVGNTLRADDGVGPLVAERLARALPGRALDAGTVPESHVGAILATRPELVLFVDAADHGGRPGSCCVLPVAELESRVPTTHAGALRLVALLLEAEGARCWLAGVQPATRALGAPMSDAVRSAAEDLAGALRTALAGEAADA
jgi:hydrogenase 3 maturation protease